MQVGTSSDSRVSPGDRLCLHLAQLVPRESPRIAPAIDLSCDSTDASPRRAQSLRGHADSRPAEDFPRRCPPSIAQSLSLGSRCGFRRYERVFKWGHPHEWAIQLPDKEFRYLRTVIVTAAVYWGLGSKLRSEELTHLLDLPAPGRRQSVYSVLRLRTLLCF